MQNILYTLLTTSFAVRRQTLATSNLPIRAGSFTYLHLMTDADETSEKPCILNIPKTVNNAQSNIYIMRTNTVHDF
jgi:hypothetical protein